MGTNITITNVSEYMETIKLYHLDNCISRGECDYYPTINAAAFRRNLSLDIQNMVREFQNYIGNTLTELQNKHFLAFSQHYGLPTNLLDFTYSPLISLYFACLGDTETSGYVHFIKNDRLININEKLELINSAFLTRFAIASDDLCDLFNGIASLFAKNEAYVFEFLEQIDNMLGVHPDGQVICKEIRAILNNTEDYQISHLDNLIYLMDKRAKKIKGLSKDIPLNELGTYNHILVQLFVFLIFVVQRDGLFDLPFYFTYEPANITNRISNQSSVFIYQLYGLNNMRQAINPDFILKINNKIEILKDLDTLGINEKFIFNDYDHIASYVKLKHQKLSDETEKTLKRLKEMTLALSNNTE